MKQIPRIEKHMSTMPHTIGKDISIKVAHEMMRHHHIRHLPVQEGGKLIGVLTDRDIKLASAFNGASEMTVEDIMTPDPYTADPSAALDQVVLNMAEHRYGCCIVQQTNGKVVGVFTATDGLRVLGEILRENYRTAKGGL